MTTPFVERIPLARPAIGELEIAAVTRVLQSGWLVTGPETARFEAAIAELCGRRHAIAVSSGTTALELSLAVLGVGAGDEVIVPAAGFPAAANAVVRAGATAVAVDIEPRSWGLSVAGVAQAATGRTRAVISIDQFGVLADGGGLEAIAARLGVPLIDDAACAIGATDSEGRRGGGYGLLGTFSFHPRKVVVTGEGGAVVCDDDELAARLRSLRNHGQVRRGEFASTGTNARLPEVAAALGTVQLARLGAMLTEREILVSGYRDRLGSLAEAARLRWQVVPAGAAGAHQTFAVVLAADLDRNAVVEALGAADIEAGLATFSLSLTAAHSVLPGVAGRRTPVADELHTHGLALPLYIGMRSEQLDRVCNTLVEVLR